MKPITACTFALLCNVVYGGVPEALDEFNKKHYEVAAKELKPLAEGGDSRAQYALACIISTRKIPSLKNMDDYVWYKKSADLGYVKAQDEIGRRYFLGEGVLANRKEAHAWFLKAAEQGNQDSQYSVATDFLYQDGIDLDVHKAIYWLSKSAKSGHIDSLKLLGKLYRKNDDMFAALEQAGISKDNKVSFDWYRKAADLNDPEAQYEVGYMYSKGLGTNVDNKEALNWYLKAANQGHALSHQNLGLLYYLGKTTPRNYSRAATYLTESAEQGWPLSMFILGDLYLTGKGVKQDFVFAYKWLSLAASKGNIKAAELQNQLETRLSNAQLAKAQALAATWKPRLSKQVTDKINSEGVLCSL